MEKLIEQLIKPILECGRISLRILLFCGQPSRCFDTLVGHNGWQPWLGFLILAFIPWMAILKSVDIEWLDISFVCSFAMMNIMYLAIWLLLFNFFLRHSSIEVDDLLLMTSVYYGPLFFWTCVLGLLLSLDDFQNTIQLSRLFKAGLISVWDVPKFSFWRATLKTMTLSGSLVGISFTIVWPAAYLMCSAALCLKMTSRYDICNEKVHYAMVMTSIMWIVIASATASYVSVPFFSVFVKEPKEGAEPPGVQMRPATDIQAVLTVLGRHDEQARRRDQAAGRRLDLARTDLRGANLFRAHLEDAVLKWAHLEDSYLEWAHLEGADLEGAAGLTREQLAEAFGDAATKVADELRPAHWPAAAAEAPDNAK